MRFRKGSRVKVVRTTPITYTVVVTSETYGTDTYGPYSTERKASKAILRFLNFDDCVERSCSIEKSNENTWRGPDTGTVTQVSRYKVKVLFPIRKFVWLWKWQVEITGFDGDGSKVHWR